MNERLNGQVERFELPHDFFPTPVPTAAADVLGATPAPGGAELYGGVGLDVWDDAHGRTFVVMCGERGEGRKFGTYCFMYEPGSSRPNWIELPGFTEGRAGVQERPGGLFAAWAEPGGRSWSRYQVPGYVTPGFPSNGQQIGAAPSITTTPPPASFTSTDQGARDQIAKLQKQVKQLEAQVADLTKRPAAVAGLTEKQVDDRVWAKTRDAMYAELGKADSGVVGRVRAIVASMLPKR